MYNDEGVQHEWIEGLIETPAGKVRKISTVLTAQDNHGNFKVRWGINRYTHTVSPGLYAVGHPDESAPVLVTANYKLTFDTLRRELAGQNLWVLVLDTKGINVWCAAGKGTFGTGELINRIKKTKLEQVVSHRKITLPQLGATGVASQKVTQSTGFKVIFGPVRAKDINEFLVNGGKVTDEMRKVRFDFKDRLVLTPMEIVPGLKFLLIPVILLAVFNVVNHHGFDFKIVTDTFFNLLPYLVALLMGAFFVPILLPYLPFRSFALKGLFLGTLWALVYVKFHSIFMFSGNNLILIGNFLLLLSISTYLALNFTGSSTYTSFSGTLRETIIAVPLVVAASIAGIGLLVAYTISNFG
ncbi:MAG: mercury methylation corrinoid protein HgcA [Thermincola sp.]|nr:mercury methylation corrinoid protein HgcA [Thermincola sp.]MDT3702324.1 mercury methylation corrinoid protein HgcA [Thermincola sp.]